MCASFYFNIKYLFKAAYFTQNLVTLVTGGAGCLGHGVASRFARKGAPVILSDLPSSNGAEIAKELGENVTFIPADVRSEKDVQQLVDEIKKKYTTLNVIANCAGTSCKQPFYNFTENRPIRFEDYQDAIQVSNFILICIQTSTNEINKLLFILFCFVFLFALDECNRYIQCVSDCS